MLLRHYIPLAFVVIAAICTLAQVTHVPVAPIAIILLIARLSLPVRWRITVWPTSQQRCSKGALSPKPVINCKLKGLEAGCESGIVFLMLSRRTALLAAVAAPLAKVVTSDASAATGKMTFCMHQGTSRAAGFRKSLEGWAKAGVKNVELSDSLLEDFLKTDTLPAAKSLIADLGLPPYPARLCCPTSGSQAPRARRRLKPGRSAATSSRHLG